MNSGQRTTFLIVAVVSLTTAVGVLIGLLVADSGTDSAEDGDDERELPQPTDRDLTEPTDPPVDEESDPQSPAPADDPSMAAMLEPVEPECPEDGEDTRHLRWTEAPPMCIDPDGVYTAVLETSRGEIEIDLKAVGAPVAVNNFVFLARWGYYDGTEFHAVFPDVSIQAGLPLGPGREPQDPGYTVAGERPEDQPFYPAYSVAMSTTSDDPGRAGGVFFIVTGAAAQIGDLYARVGQVTDPDSQEVVDAIDGTGIARAGHDGTPMEETIIESVTIRQD